MLVVVQMHFLYVFPCELSNFALAFTCNFHRLHVNKSLFCTNTNVCSYTDNIEMTSQNNLKQDKKMFLSIISSAELEISIWLIGTTYSIYLSLVLPPKSSVRT